MSDSNLCFNKITIHNDVCISLKIIKIKILMIISIKFFYYKNFTLSEVV